MIDKDIGHYWHFSPTITHHFYTFAGFLNVVFPVVYAIFFPMHLVVSIFVDFREFFRDLIHAIEKNDNNMNEKKNEPCAMHTMLFNSWVYMRSGKKKKN